MVEKKIHAFEYLLSRLLIWQEESGQITGMTRVKALKLLFFVASVPVDNNDLLEIFDKFYAMPFGPVESDIYDAMANDMLPHYDFSETMMSIKKEYVKPSELSANVYSAIDRAMGGIKGKNRELISLSAFDLVEYSHTWSCWKDAIFMAQILDRGSYPMSKEDIRTSAKEVWA